MSSLFSVPARANQAKPLVDRSRCSSSSWLLAATVLISWLNMWVPVFILAVNDRSRHLWYSTQPCNARSFYRIISFLIAVHAPKSQGQGMRKFLTSTSGQSTSCQWQRGTYAKSRVNLFLLLVARKLKWRPKWASKGSKTLRVSAKILTSKLLYKDQVRGQKRARPL